MTGLEMRKTKMQMSVFNLCWMAIPMNIYRRQNGQCSALCCVNFINETITSNLFFAGCLSCHRGCLRTLNASVI